MSEWIGDKAVEAVQALSGERAALVRELRAAHEMLSQMKVPNAVRTEAGMARPLTLTERIQALHGIQSQDVRRVAEAALAPPAEPGAME